MTKPCIKIHVKSDSAIESAFSWIPCRRSSAGSKGHDAPHKKQQYAHQLLLISFSFSFSCEIHIFIL